jgi:maltooligosyltrehalose trehalohydrolase
VAHRHRMPFGAEPVEDGVRFALWAPGAERVEVELEAGRGPAHLPMTSKGGGWFRLLAAEAGPGSRYRFRIDGGASVPDPASRFQPEGVHGPSVVVDPSAHEWRDDGWGGRAWEEAVVYELHVGTFTPDGTYDGVARRLGELADLGVTAVELMPVAAFSGTRGWGYDGVLPFAPHEPYGPPGALKSLVDACHARGLMIFLDVVYNHFGPDGNYLHLYAPQFFTDRFQTPWGDAVDFSRRAVRDFVIHNALYWLEEFRFDGLRLDAVHAIRDDGSPDILEELAEAVHRRVGRGRAVHLSLENGKNQARYLARGEDGRPRHYVAQWNDDIHHALHVVATGEDQGYYEAYADDPHHHLCRCLAEGFAYQGEPFPYGEVRERGEPSAHLPPTAFVSFIQNHDQVGNRAFGERLEALGGGAAAEALATVLLLAPSPPLLFMGEEWGAPEPFLYFCDFHDELADAVREGRRREFARFPAFRDEGARERIPDPNAEETFRRSVLDWARRGEEGHRERLELYRELLDLRRREIVPRLAGVRGVAARCRRFGAGGVAAEWRLGDGVELGLLANLSGLPNDEAPAPGSRRLLRATDPGVGGELEEGRLSPWAVAWFL